jgi:hypothetical protein
LHPAAADDPTVHLYFFYGCFEMKKHTVRKFPVVVVVVVVLKAMMEINFVVLFSLLNPLDDDTADAEVTTKLMFVQVETCFHHPAADEDDDDWHR